MNNLDRYSKLNRLMAEIAEDDDCHFNNTFGNRPVVEKVVATVNAVTGMAGMAMLEVMEGDTDTIQPIMPVLMRATRCLAPALADAVDALATINLDGVTVLGEISKKDIRTITDGLREVNDFLDDYDQMVAAPVVSLSQVKAMRGLGNEETPQAE